jgi:hypothetical protein
MNLMLWISGLALALGCFVFNAWSASVPYPNQAFIFSGESFSALPGFTNIKAFALEGDRVLAVTREGRVMASGLGENWLPEEALTNAVAVGLNYTSAAVLTADGRVFESGRSGSLVSNAIALDVSGQFNDDDLDYKLSVTSDGQVVVWGNFGCFDCPPAVVVEVPGVVSAAGGWSHIVALKSDGTVVQWDGGYLPEAVEGLSNVVAVAAGGSHSVALKADGSVVAWGANYRGQINVPAGLSNVVAIAASEDHSLALKRDGTLTAWGQSYFGSEATAPASLSNVVAIAASGTQNLALVSIPPARPVLGIAANTPNSGQLTITLSGEPNKVYAIESSADFGTWDFVQYVTNHTGSASFEVGNTNGNTRFFRAK